MQPVDPGHVVYYPWDEFTKTEREHIETELNVRKNTTKHASMSKLFWFQTSGTVMEKYILKQHFHQQHYYETSNQWQINGNKKVRSKISGIQKRTQKMMMMAINNNQVKTWIITKCYTQHSTRIRDTEGDVYEEEKKDVSLTEGVTTNEITPIRCNIHIKENNSNKS